MVARGIMALSQRETIRRIRLVAWMQGMDASAVLRKAGIKRGLHLRVEGKERDAILDVLDVPLDVWRIKDESTFIRTLQAQYKNKRNADEYRKQSESAGTGDGHERLHKGPR
jgi:hypothetical protein